MSETMRVTEQEYKCFREDTEKIKNILDEMERTIGSVPFTVEFLHNIENTISDLQKMYYREIRH